MPLPDILQETGAGRFSICKVAHHDTASAVAALPSPEPHSAYISSGTWSLMGTETDQMITTDAAFQHNFANEGGANGSNRFLKNIMGLWLLQECRREFAAKGIVSTFEEMEAKAALAAPFRSIIDPDDPLFFQPGDMISKIQSRCRDWGQPVPETEGEITRCIQESLALAYRAILEQLEQLTGFQVPCVHIIGGGARSELLNRLCRFCHAADPSTPDPYEAAAIGNLCAQFIAAGEISGWDEARSVVSTSFEIRQFQAENDPRWDEAYERFFGSQYSCLAAKLEHLTIPRALDYCAIFMGNRFSSQYRTNRV